MRKSFMIVAGIAIAGIAAAGGSAFTGGGVTRTAPDSQFVGGTVTQSVTGATLSDVAYTYSADPSNTAVHLVTLTFADIDSNGKVASVVLTGSTNGAFVCGVITAKVSTCTATTDSKDVTAIAVTVDNPAE